MMIMFKNETSSSFAQRQLELLMESMDLSHPQLKQQLNFFGRCQKWLDKHFKMGGN